MNYKRHKPKTHTYPTCPICMFDGPEGPTRMSGNHHQKSTMGRNRAHDFRQPQFYPDED